VKNGSDHHVPLTKQMLAHLRPILASLDADDRLFSTCTGNTMLPALKALEGCAGVAVHGFRSTFKDSATRRRLLATSSRKPMAMTPARTPPTRLPLAQGDAQAPDSVGRME
jgi:integrase